MLRDLLVHVDGSEAGRRRVPLEIDQTAGPESEEK